MLPCPPVAIGTIIPESIRSFQISFLNENFGEMGYSFIYHSCRQGLSLRWTRQEAAGIPICRSIEFYRDMGFRVLFPSESFFILGQCLSESLSFQETLGRCTIRPIPPCACQGSRNGLA